MKFLNKNKLSETNRKKILNAFTSRKDAEYFTKLIDNKIITENDYRMDVSNYVVKEDTNEVIEIVELNKKIAKIVARQNELRKAIDDVVVDIEGNK